MTDEQMIEALERMRNQARGALRVAKDEGHVNALQDVARSSEVLMEIIRISMYLPKGDGTAPTVGVSFAMLANSIRAEIQRMVDERGWSV